MTNKYQEGAAVYDAMVNNYNLFRRGGVGDKKSHVDMVNNAITLCKQYENPFRKIVELEERLSKAGRTIEMFQNAAVVPDGKTRVTAVKPKREKREAEENDESI